MICDSSDESRLPLLPLGRLLSYLLEDLLLVRTSFFSSLLGSRRSVPSPGFEPVSSWIFEAATKVTDWVSSADKINTSYNRKVNIIRFNR